MLIMLNQTIHPKQAEVVRQWHLIDAEGRVLGRVASAMATILRGKNKVFYSPHVDGGDFVILINADKIRLTGKKLTQKFHYRHSTYPGGFRSVRYDRLMAKNPQLAVRDAVYNMLPDNHLRERQILRLKIFRGPIHRHGVQNPQPFDLDGVL